MSQYIAEGGTPRPIERYAQLVEYFEQGCKPRERWGIGTEYETVAVRADTGEAVPFTGGIEEVLRRLADRHGWEPVEESGRTVALRRAGASITLEPGGQLELSGRVCRTIHETRAEFSAHVAEVVGIGSELGIAFLGLGMQPFSPPDAIEWVPKRRYAIMGPYMRRVGRLGERMMKQTATVQMNLDYGSERDAMQKLRTAMGTGALLTAMFANSPISDGGLNGFLSYRAHIWTETDPARCGLLRFVFEPGAGFRDYVEYALDVPMYFIVRAGRWIDMTAFTFRRFWAEGHAGERATLEDWAVHLTTLFPEARLKRFIEIRSVDSQPPDLMLAAPALVKGIFYDADCLDAAWDLVKGWRWEERLQLYHEVPHAGLRARVRGIAVRDYAWELLRIAETGLDRQRPADAAESEAMYLERVRDLVRAGRCPADLLIDKWTGVWNHDVSRLVHGTTYRVAA